MDARHRSIPKKPVFVHTQALLDDNFGAGKGIRTPDLLHGKQTL